MRTLFRKTWFQTYLVDEIYNDTYVLEL